MRPPLSASVITLNEEHNIRECLDSLAWVDELVVVDGGSTDGTKEICREYTDKVFVNPWPGHYQQKNFALECATHDWILSIDADERVSLALRHEIENVLARPDRADGYTIPRRNIFLGRWMRHGGWYPDRVLRLFRKSHGRFGGVNPHDRVELRGRVGKLEELLLHFTYRSVAQYVDKQYRYACIAAQERTVRKGPQAPGVTAMGGRPLIKFLEAFLLKRGFLDGFHGLLTALFAASFAFVRQAKIRELSGAGWRMGKTFPTVTEGAGGLDAWFAGFNRDTDVAAANALRDKRAVRWWDILFRPVSVFLRLYILKGGVRMRADGFIYAGLGAFSEFTKYAKMWEALDPSLGPYGRGGILRDLSQPAEMPARRG